jgi:osmotically-inducible protein OsmY
VVFGLALFSGRPYGRRTTVNILTIDDHSKVNADIVKDPDAHYFKIDVTTTQGDVVLQGFVNSREAEARLVAKIREIKGVKSVKSLLKMEEKK